MSLRAAVSVVCGLALVAPALTARQPADDELLARARVYAGSYGAAFSNLMSEERSEQEFREPPPAGSGSAAPRGLPGMAGNVEPPRPNGISRVRLRANYLVVRADTGLGWLPFRDVFEVNGRAVADRQDRLVTLLADATPADLARARALMDEGTRHDLGNLARTVNIPVLGLLFLHPDRASRTAFARLKTERIDGHPTAVYAFTESGTPTLVRGIDERDVASSGRIWIDEQTASVRRTEHRVESGNVVATITVTYRDDAAAGDAGARADGRGVSVGRGRRASSRSPRATAITGACRWTRPRASPPRRASRPAGEPSRRGGSRSPGPLPQMSRARCALVRR
jgi:hypothetical protein